MQTLHVGAFYNQLVPVHIETGDNYYSTNICYQMNDSNAILFVLDDHVD
jgi:hypothetical protein